MLTPQGKEEKMMSCGRSFAGGWWSLQLSPGRRRGAAPAWAGYKHSSFFLQCILTELQAWACFDLDKNKSLKCFCEMKTISEILLSDRNESDFLLIFSAPWVQISTLGSYILLPNPPVISKPGRFERKTICCQNYSKLLHKSWLPKGLLLVQK